MSKKEIVILSGVRTAIGDFGGSLKGFSPSDMGAAVLEEAIKRSNLDPSKLGHCVFGNVVHTEAADMYLSRVVALKAGVPETTPAVTVNRLCGSGLQAIITAAQQIELGYCTASVAGGAESMSRAPYHATNARFGNRMGDSTMVDMMLGALTCPIEKVHMGLTAEAIATKWEISREEQDTLAVEGHNRAQNAIEKGYFKEQIFPMETKSRRGTTVFDTDEHVRLNCTSKDLSSLRAAFKKDGTVTAGNASGLNDAAAAVVLMDAEAAAQQGLKPMAKLVDYSVVGVEPLYMGIGPVPAIRQLLEANNLAVDDIDIWEVNEAFASQAIAVARDLKIPPEKINPNGSGISLGHPIGATGAVISVKAIYELQRTQTKFAVVSMCIGGGQGIAALFERV